MARVSSRMAAHVRIYTRLHTLSVVRCVSLRQPLFIIGKQIIEGEYLLPLFRPPSEIFVRINFIIKVIIQLTYERYFFLSSFFSSA